MKISNLFLIFGITITLLLGSSYKAAGQCAMCKANIEAGQKSGAKVGLGLNTGILYLLAAPYLLIGSLGVYWYVNYKNNKSDKSRQ